MTKATLFIGSSNRTWAVELDALDAFAIQEIVDGLHPLPDDLKGRIRLIVDSQRGSGENITPSKLYFTITESDQISVETQEDREIDIWQNLVDGRSTELLKTLEEWKSIRVGKLLPS